MSYTKAMLDHLMNDPHLLKIELERVEINAYHKGWTDGFQRANEIVENARRNTDGKIQE